VDSVTGVTTSKYYFWVRGRNTSETTIPTLQLEQVIAQSPDAFAIWQDLRTEEEGYGLIWGNSFDAPPYGLPGRYRQLVIRGLANKVDVNNRYALRITNDETLRDSLDATTLAKKTVHSEWKLFRKLQSYKIDRQLWNRVVEAAIGHMLGEPTKVVPSQDRVLYDSLTGSNSRYGMDDGQAFMPSVAITGLINTVLTRELGSFNGFGGAQFIAAYNTKSSAGLQAMLEDLYDLATTEQLNYLFFELMLDALTYNTSHEQLFKTSYISVNITRKQLGNATLVSRIGDEGCRAVPGTTTTTRMPTPIDYVDVSGCVPLTTQPPITVAGELDPTVCDGRVYTEALSITGGSGVYVAVDVVEGTIPAWLTMQLSGPNGATLSFNGTVVDCCTTTTTTTTPP
jgi:hypothetical protein